MKTGIELITEERREQIEKHNRSVATDVKYNIHKQLRIAAASLISDNAFISECPVEWNKYIWNKMKRKSLKDRLIIAGALIAAEIDRIQSKEEHETIF